MTLSSRERAWRSTLARSRIDCAILPISPCWLSSMNHSSRLIESTYFIASAFDGSAFSTSWNASSALASFSFPPRRSSLTPSWNLSWALSVPLTTRATAAARRDLVNELAMKIGSLRCRREGSGTGREGLEQFAPRPGRALPGRARAGTAAAPGALRGWRMLSSARWPSRARRLLPGDMEAYPRVRGRDRAAAMHRTAGRRTPMARTLRVVLPQGPLRSLGAEGGALAADRAHGGAPA